MRIVEDGELLTTPFLTVPNVDTSGDSGLLSIAFAPDYSTSGLFYVYTVAAGADTLDPSAQPGEMRVVEYRRSESDPDLADPASARLVLEQSHGGADPLRRPARLRARRPPLRDDGRRRDRDKRADAGE